ncbi:unnamed protein product [Moneuplotes crassus]|uniref:Uncharacterized protein n=1 Tax=Euplotes crassus TaxID=5936 RepID=A0AAD1UBP1_EUPCR|nr:unnamed protein product [Moneuplotes crassus]
MMRMQRAATSQSNYRNPYIKHTMFKPNKNLMKQLIEESKRERKIEINQTMDKFKDILCNRQKRRNIKIKKKIANSRSIKGSTRDNRAFIRKLQESINTSFDNEEKQAYTSKNLNDYSLYPSSRGKDFNQSFTRKSATQNMAQNMIQSTKSKVKQFARLMSARPEFPERVSEFRKFINLKTLQTSHPTHSTTTKRSLSKTNAYCSDYNSAVTVPSCPQNSRPRVRTSFEKLRKI